jgi:hypothetical protein
MRWLDVEEGHHSLSHEPDKNEDAQKKLKRINQWFAGELAYLVKKLDETPEPGGDGSMLDHSTVIWTNELGKGNSHSHSNIPFLLIGNGSGFEMGQCHDFGGIPHNRFLLALAHAFGHELETFGSKKHCADGALSLG